MKGNRNRLLRLVEAATQPGQRRHKHHLISIAIAALGIFGGGIDAANGRVVGASPIDPVKLPSDVRVRERPAASAQHTQDERDRQKALDANAAGNAALQRHNPAAAIERFTEALSYLPDNPVIRHNLQIARGLRANEKGMILESQGNLEDAVKRYKQAAADLPLDKTIRENLSRANRALRLKTERDGRRGIKQEQHRRDRRPPTKTRSHSGEVLPT